MANPQKPPNMRGRRAVFKPDHKSFGRFILSDQMRDVTEEIAKDIADLAGQLAPRRKAGSTPNGAAMADQFKVNRNAGAMKVDRAFRVKVEVYNNAPSAAPNEFGGKGGAGNERHRMLGRAGARFGDFKGDNFPTEDGIG